ncbi:riboflavin synthase [Malonomonas rubra]|uniref:riboflavin synthase n=1 Tax=Malonomonas rubra TaxID=57040 RepID=UPI0026F0BE84|nr:riboflavin synthase [Malonomonas rubra]
MFTGLIQAVGTVRSLKRQGNSAVLQIASELAREELHLGESIAVNGVCLTVVSWDEHSFSADVSPETLDCSNLGSLRANMQVNLERALRLCDRLGGHLVSGHIDCVAIVKKRFQDQNAVRFEFSVPEEALRYLVAKGSVAIDGISLTVNTVSEDSFSVAIIPHSLEMTTLQHCREGARVNIETDLVGRYVERLLEAKSDSKQGEGISLEFLAKNGFM